MTEQYLRSGDQYRTAAQAKERSLRIAAILRERGVRTGDRYAIVMRNELTFVEAAMAATSIGAIPVPVNWHWTGADLAHILNDSESKVVFVHTDLLDAVEINKPAAATIIEVEVPDFVARTYRSEKPALSGRYEVLESLIAATDPVPDTVVTPSLGLLYTSGTTGFSKGVVRERVEDPEALARGIAQAYRMDDPSWTTLVTAPLYHASPLYQATFATALGMNVVVMPKFDAVEFLRSVAEEPIQHAQVVPTMLRRLLSLDQDVQDSYDVSALRSVLHSAAAISVEQKKAAIEWFGPVFHEFYGGTETGPVVACTSEEWLRHPGTVGRRFADGDYRILRADGTRAEIGEPGQIYLRSMGPWPDFTYHRDPEKRRSVEVDGYITIGDVGYEDADGYLYLTDRAIDMVNSGGVNLYPKEVENVILGLDDVVDVAVIGIPHEDLGEHLAAHVELRPGSALTEADIAAHVRANLAKYKVPSVVVLDADLPREETGKIFKRRLRERYWPAAAETSTSAS
ncbi:putative fatty-acid--CoA ligase [Nocardia nova SH22a]|uniref:Putative fatty-acid--CoA ligase n=1 Tax=Nocardia nova SH22a TaxID=1415166 RepID=W5TRG4_9NOCA|nr:AMP-binding protein [Nocardia nova]AHH19836.1 putative fatty-acid--CoA ligase [Nocardia nova SH22a]